jgi:hypothetical protein
MEKVSEAQVNTILIKAASVLRTQETRIKELENKVAGYERLDHAEKIASAAVERGIMAADEAEAYAQDLANSDKDLKMVEDFVSRAAAGVPLGKMLEKVASEDREGGTEPGSAESRFNDFLLTSDMAG